MLHDQNTYINIKKILLINSRTRHALCSQDGQKTIILQLTFTKEFLQEFFRGPMDCQKYINRVTILVSSFPLLITILTSSLLSV